MIHRNGSQFILQTQQQFDRTPEELFPFFADAANLSRITPPWVNFEILTSPPIDMHQGTLIDYRIRLFRVPMRWRTKITHWQPPYQFVDTQISGPYHDWIHEHIFERNEQGTLMHDRVTFRSRGPGIVVAPLHALFVNRNVSRIFRYRQQILRDLFPAQRDDTAGAAQVAASC